MRSLASKGAKLVPVESAKGLAPREERQLSAAIWAMDIFGADVVNDVKERALRVLEESIELAQAEGVSIEDAIRQVHHVYAKPVGDPKQEAGGVGLTLLVYSEVAGYSADALEAAELARVLKVPRHIARARHAAKAKAGVARKGATRKGGRRG